MKKQQRFLVVKKTRFFSNPACDVYMLPFICLNEFIPGKAVYTGSSFWKFFFAQFVTFYKFYICSRAYKREWGQLKKISISYHNILSFVMYSHDILWKLKCIHYEWKHLNLRYVLESWDIQLPSCKQIKFRNRINI